MGKDGFTIIELIVVLAIITILLVIAGLAGKSWMDRYYAERQMREMYVDLMNARVSAMQRNRVFFAVLTDTQYTVYEDTSPGPDGNGALDTAADRQVMQKDLSAAYSITWTGANTIQFDTKGIVTAGLGAVRTSTLYGSEYNCIALESTRIKMGAWNGTDCIAK